MCLRGATVTSWPIWGTVSELAAQDSLWKLMCVFSSVRRQKDKERKSRLSLFLTKSGSHENVSPTKKTNTAPSK